jgi:hypothetical protein
MSLFGGVRWCPPKHKSVRPKSGRISTLRPPEYYILTGVVKDPSRLVQAELIYRHNTNAFHKALAIMRHEAENSSYRGRGATYTISSAINEVRVASRC